MICPHCNKPIEYSAFKELQAQLEMANAELAILRKADIITFDKFREIEQLRQQLDELKVKYEERRMAMMHTGDMVRSIYEPKLKIAREALEQIRGERKAFGACPAYAKAALEKLDAGFS